MALLRLVVERRAALHGLHQLRHVERLGGAGREQGFGQVDERAAVAVGHGAQHGAGVGFERQGAALGLLRAGEQGLKRAVVQPVEHKHRATREQGAVQLERGILGGGAHQNHGAVLDHGQEGVLLRPVEAVDLVDEEQGAGAAGAVLAGIGKHLA